jgi:hypothetical protein
LCISSYSVQSESARATLATHNLEGIGEVISGLVTPFPDYGVLKPAVDAYVSGWLYRRRILRIRKALSVRTCTKRNTSTDADLLLY